MTVYPDWEGQQKAKDEGYLSIHHSVRHDPEGAKVPESELGLRLHRLTSEIEHSEIKEGPFFYQWARAALYLRDSLLFRCAIKAANIKEDVSTSLVRGQRDRYRNIWASAMGQPDIQCLVTLIQHKFPLGLPPRHTYDEDRPPCALSLWASKGDNLEPCLLYLTYLGSQKPTVEICNELMDSAGVLGVHARQPCLTQLARALAPLPNLFLSSCLPAYAKGAVQSFNTDKIGEIMTYVANHRTGITPSAFWYSDLVSDTHFKATGNETGFMGYIHMLSYLLDKLPVPEAAGVHMVHQLVEGLSMHKTARQQTLGLLRRKELRPFYDKIYAFNWKGESPTFAFFRTREAVVHKKLLSMGFSLAGPGMLDYALKQNVGYPVLEQIARQADRNELTRAAAAGFVLSSCHHDKTTAALRLLQGRKTNFGHLLADCASLVRKATGQREQQRYTHMMTSVASLTPKLPRLTGLPDYLENWYTRLRDLRSTKSKVLSQSTPVPAMSVDIDLV